MQRSLVTVATLLALACIARTAGSAGAPPPAAPVHPFFTAPIRIVAHRGGAALAPENTLAAFHSIAERWPDAVIECDVRRTSDGVPVLLHDPTVDRTTEGSGEIARTTLAAAQSLDAAFEFTTDGGKTFPSRGRGVRIPTLVEALRALPTSRFEIEIKEGVDAVPAVVAAVREASAESRVLLASPRTDVLARVRTLAPGAATNLDEASARGLLAALRSGEGRLAPPSGQLLTADPRQLAEAGVGRAEIAALARLGVPVQAFTIDDPAEMRRLQDLGVTSLVTNRPDLVAALEPRQADAAGGGPGGSPARAAPRSVVILGDSIGDPPAGSTGYATLIGVNAKLTSPEARVVRAARSGARSRDLPAQAASLPAALPSPIAVLVTIGGNDLREATPSVLVGADLGPRAALVQNVGTALDELLRPGRFGAGAEVRVYLATIYDSSDGQGGFRERGCPIPVGKLDTSRFFARWNDDLRALATARGVTLVDLHQLFHGHGLGTASPWYLGDCIHPNDTGHAQIARAFSDAIGVGGAAEARAAPSPRPYESATASAAQTPAPAGRSLAVSGPGVHEGAFEVRLKSGAAFKVRKYTDRGDSIEVKRAGLLVTIRKSEIAAITAVD